MEGVWFFVVVVFNFIDFEPALEMLMSVCLPSTAVSQRKTSKYLKADIWLLVYKKEKRN